MTDDKTFVAAGRGLGYTGRGVGRGGGAFGGAEEDAALTSVMGGCLRPLKG